jgi:hypothetical protein
MKKLILVLLVITSIASCNTSSEPDVSYELIHNCLPIPDDVPKTFASGTPIDWDCEMKAFYVEGKLNFYYNDAGGLVAIEKVR